jgi:DNA-binding response OmpR family regulator
MYSDIGLKLLSGRGPVMPPTRRLALPKPTTVENTKAKTALIIEDDLAVGALLAQVTTQIGLSPCIVTAGRAGVRAATCDAPELIVLDLSLPDITGLCVAKELRDRGFAMPIIVVTGLDSVDDEIASFVAGLTDYLRKPFDVDVFKIRALRAIEDVARRKQSVVLTVGSLQLDRASGIMTCAGSQVALSALEARLLSTLAAKAEQLVTVHELARDVWGHRTALATNTYRVHIQRVRRRLLSVDCELGIQTIRGAGYVLTSRLRRQTCTDRKEDPM